MIQRTLRRALALALCASLLASASSPSPARGAEPAAKPGAPPAARGVKGGAPVSDAEKLQFQQKNAEAQLRELQERMYRLAELTREAEPDDAARLLMAVRKAREQLIIEQMKEVLEHLGRSDLAKAVEEEKQVLAKLEELKKLLLATDLDLQMQLEKLRKLQAALAKLDAVVKEEQRQKAEAAKLAGEQKQNKPADPKAFDALKQDQERNRQSTDAVSQAAKELGQSGAKALASLGGASKSMSAAEGSLGGKKAGDAEAKQGEAVEALKKAREELDRERKKLLSEIEKQVRGQVMENLRHMLERQEQVRKATEALGARLASADREATLRAKQLAQAEEHLVNVAGQTVQLIEETGFSVALPPAIRAIQSQCVHVVAHLNAGRGDAKVVAAQRQIERDITDLLDTLKESGGSAGEGGECKSCGNNKNKLLAELKILRLMQTRVNVDTRDTHATRAAVADLSPDLRQKILGVRDGQSQVRDAMAKLHESVCPDCIGGTH